MSQLKHENSISDFELNQHLYVKKVIIQNFKDIQYQKVFFLSEFHKNHKYLLMTYNPLTLKKLGRIVANQEHFTKEKTYDKYYEILLSLLELPPTRKNRLNTLFHIYGYFKDSLTKTEKDEYFKAQNQYVDHQLSFLDILQILESYVIRFDDQYLKDQVIFSIYNTNDST